MKTSSYFFIVAAMFILLVSLKKPEKNKVFNVNNGNDTVMAILQNSCYGCHNAKGRNQDAVKALNLDEWDNLSEIKKIGAREEICEEIEKGEMPPAKFLEYKPEKKLTAEQIKLICNWAKEENDKALE